MEWQNCFILREMDTLSRLHNLVGKKGLLHINANELEFTFLSVIPPPTLSISGDELQDFKTAITDSQFEVRFDEGTLVNGNNSMIASGRYISFIKKIYEGLGFWDRSAKYVLDPDTDTQIEKELMARWPPSEYPVNIKVVGIQNTLEASIQINNFADIEIIERVSFGPNAVADVIGKVASIMEQCMSR